MQPSQNQRLEDLKKYGRDVATWYLLPIEWRARVPFGILRQNPTQMASADGLAHTSQAVT